MAIGNLVHQHRFTRQRRPTCCGPPAKNSTRKLPEVAFEGADTGTLTSPGTLTIPGTLASTHHGPRIGHQRLGSDQVSRQGSSRVSRRSGVSVSPP